MNWYQRWWAGWRGEGPTRVAILSLEGLERGLVDRYFEEGSLPNLAFLGDVGQRFDVDDCRSLDPIALCEALRQRRVRARFIPPPRIASPADLDVICAADRAQQERLIAALERRRPRVIVASFPMMVQLAELFGPTPGGTQQQVLRDVVARMDEVVGKALSVIDARTILLVVLHPCRTATDVVMPASVFSSRALADGPQEAGSFASVVLALLVEQCKRERYVR
jgi:hypothetical protein